MLPEERVFRRSLIFTLLNPRIPLLFFIFNAHGEGN